MSLAIAFYLPLADRPPFERLPAPEELMEHPGRFLSPALNWTWRTYLHLSEAGIPCRLVASIPSDGITVCAACNLPLFFRPGPGQIIICCVADSPAPFFTQLNVYQCRTQADRAQRGDALPMAAHLPHWPQPGLLPRQESRGDEFKHLDYFGARDQLSPELCAPQFVQKIDQLGLTLRFNFELFHDYRETDAVLAARTFHGPAIVHKPASKLVNAWFAGVPAILGAEEGFRELRRGPDDYLEVNSVDATLAAVRRLAEDTTLRRRMRLNAQQRAKEFSQSAMIEQWRELLDARAPEVQQRWRDMSGMARRRYFLTQYYRRFLVSVRRRLSTAPHHLR